MSKLQLIEAIRQHNRSANQNFLIGFDEEALRSYLSRLTHIAGCRGRNSVWVRRNNTPAVVSRFAAA